MRARPSELGCRLNRGETTIKNGPDALEMGYLFMPRLAASSSATVERSSPTIVAMVRLKGGAVRTGEQEPRGWPTLRGAVSLRISGQHTQSRQGLPRRLVPLRLRTGTARRAALERSPCSLYLDARDLQ